MALGTFSCYNWSLTVSASGKSLFPHSWSSNSGDWEAPGLSGLSNTEDDSDFSLFPTAAFPDFSPYTTGMVLQHCTARATMRICNTRSQYSFLSQTFYPNPFSEKCVETPNILTFNFFLIAAVNLLLICTGYSISCKHLPALTGNQQNNTQPLFKPPFLQSSFKHSPMYHKSISLSLVLSFCTVSPLTTKPLCTSYINIKIGMTSHAQENA